MVLKKKEELSIIPDRKLTKLARSFEIDDNIAIRGDKTYKGHVISFEELYDLMSQMRGIQESLEKTYPDLLYEQKETLIYNSTSEALKEILRFLKTIDNDLYLFALKLFVGQGNGSIEIYNKFDNNNHNNKGNRSCNNRDGSIYLVLNQDISKEEANLVSSVLKTDKCSISEVIVMMHEISHSFDRGDITLKRFGKNAFAPISLATAFYLPETTAIFFETLFAQYFINKYPAYKNTIDRIIGNRARSKLKSVDKTYVKAGLVKIKKEKGYVPENYLTCLKGEDLSKRVREVLLKEPNLSFSRRYALAMLFVPTMVKVYNENPKEGNDRIRKYLKCNRENDFDGALAAFGIDLDNKESVKSLIYNYKDFIIKYCCKDLEKGKEEDFII